MRHHFISIRTLPATLSSTSGPGPTTHGSAKESLLMLVVLPIHEHLSLLLHCHCGQPLLPLLLLRGIDAGRRSRHDPQRSIQFRPVQGHRSVAASLAITDAAASISMTTRRCGAWHFKSKRLLVRPTAFGRHECALPQRHPAHPLLNLANRELRAAR